MAARAFVAHHDAVWLDSAETGRSSNGRYSAIAVDPLVTVRAADGHVAEIQSAGTVERVSDGFWSAWEGVQRSLPRWPAGQTSLMPGWFGYLGYELNGLLERLPAPRVAGLGLSSGRMGLFDRVVVLDHVQRSAVAIDADGLRTQLGLAAAERSFDDWVSAWNDAATTAGTMVGPQASVVVRVPAERHLDAIERALEYIAAGDIYQVNLARRIDVEQVRDPLALYAALRQSNPAPFAAWQQWGDEALASVSPELFLRARNGYALTSPIKGTAARDASECDSAARMRLLSSEKDAAELAMIVDLHRNDLGRVCLPGTVRVRTPRRVEVHPTVLHTVADIEGRLRPGVSEIELIRACFPAGSITGVPKIRAMEIIHELETCTRGAYTGAIGALGLDGQLTLSVAIRTMQLKAGRGSVYAGGGIVADSVPADELAETDAKVEGILRACGAPALSGSTT